jgi:hypothetical protein
MVFISVVLGVHVKQLPIATGMALIFECAYISCNRKISAVPYSEYSTEYYNNPNRVRSTDRVHGVRSAPGTPSYEFYVRVIGAFGSLQMTAAVRADAQSKQHKNTKQVQLRSLFLYRILRSIKLQ